jgi:hypothetical protein
MLNKETAFLRDLYGKVHTEEFGGNQRDSSLDWNDSYQRMTEFIVTRESVWP